MPRQRDTLEMIRQKTTMSQDITKKDEAYGVYAGASLSDALGMATVRFIIHRNPPPPPAVKAKLEDFLAFKDEQRKAYFAATSSEITQLGFIKGLPYDRVSATRKTKRRTAAAHVSAE